MSDRDKHIGNSFDDFLKEDGIYDDVQEQLKLDLIILELDRKRKKLKLSKAGLAKRMGIHRSDVERLFDASYAETSLDILRQTASALGCRIAIALQPAHSLRGRKSSPKKTRAIA